MLRVLHTADWHLGYRQYHKPEREQDFIDAASEVVDKAIEEDVNAVVHGGDLFEHSKNVSQDTLLEALTELKRLQKNNIPFLSVVGNHDGSHSGADWHDVLVSAGVTTRLSSEPYQIGNTAFYGLDHQGRSERSSLSYQFSPADNASHNVLVAHGLFQPLSMGASWDIAEVLEKSNIDFDAVLLGDDHAAKQEDVGGTLVTYSGSPEQTQASQTGHRGANLVSIEGGDVELNRVDVDARPLYRTEIEIPEGEDGFELVKQELDEQEFEGAVVSVFLTGEGSPSLPSEIEEYVMENGAFHCSVSDPREFGEDRIPSDVEFADPEAAARDRAREMNLSEAGEHAEEIIREGNVVDSNIADDAEDWVEGELSDNPEAFTRPDPEETNESVDDTPDTEDTDTPDTEDTDTPDTEDTDTPDTEDTDTPDTEDTDTPSESTDGNSSLSNYL